MTKIFLDYYCVAIHDTTMRRSEIIKADVLKLIRPLEKGSALPSRTALCDLLKTNRVVLDQAIRMLVEEGILIAKKGSGTYVANLIPTVRSWGVIVPDVADPIYAALVRGIEDVAHRLGRSIIVCNSDFDISKQADYIDRLIGHAVDGFVIVPVLQSDLKENYRMFMKLRHLATPYVFCNRLIDGIDAPAVLSNDFYGGYIATKHLLRNGYERIAYLAPITYKGSIDRCQGYITALQEARMTEDRTLIVMDEPTENEHGDQRIARLISEYHVDAFFCFNDALANKVLDISFELNHPVGIVGYNDSILCEQASTKLTSVRYRSQEIGSAAANLLSEILQTGFSGSYRLFSYLPELIVRQSSLPMRARSV